MTDPLDPDTPYITPTAVRAAVSGLSDTTKFPDDTLARFVAEWEGLIEADLGRALTPRTFTTSVPTPRTGPLLLPYFDVTEITALAYDQGTAPDIADVTVVDGYSLLPGAWGVGSWACGRLVTLSGVRGEPAPPPAAIDGCTEYVRAEAIQQAGSQPRNITGERTDLGWIPEPTADLSKGRLTRWTICNEKIDLLRLTYGRRPPAMA